MLVLGRKEGEALLIGQDIRITVVRAGVNVRLGIETPPGVPVLRAELLGRQRPGEGENNGRGADAPK